MKLTCSARHLANVGGGPRLCHAELQEAAWPLPSGVVGSDVIAQAWVSSRGAVGTIANKDAFEACRQLACLVRRREDVGGGAGEALDL